MESVIMPRLNVARSLGHRMVHHRPDQPSSVLANRLLLLNNIAEPRRSLGALTDRESTTRVGQNDDAPDIEDDP